jgi:hypothetical protein
LTPRPSCATPQPQRARLLAATQKGIRAKHWAASLTPRPSCVILQERKGRGCSPPHRKGIRAKHWAASLSPRPSCATPQPQRARLLAATQKGSPREALGGELVTATVLRDSSTAKGAAARRHTERESARSIGRQA